MFIEHIFLQHQEQLIFTAGGTFDYTVDYLLVGGGGGGGRNLTQVVLDGGGAGLVFLGRQVDQTESVSTYKHRNYRCWWWWSRTSMVEIIIIHGIYA